MDRNHQFTTIAYASANITIVLFSYLHKLYVYDTLLYPGRADDFSQVYIHPVVTAHQVTVVGFPILKLYQLEHKRKRIYPDLSCK